MRTPSATWLDFSKDWTNLAVGGHDSTPSSSVGPGSSCPYSSLKRRLHLRDRRPAARRRLSSIPSSGSNKGYICPSNSIGCYDSVLRQRPQRRRSSAPAGSPPARATAPAPAPAPARTRSAPPTITTNNGYTHTWFVDNDQMDRLRHRSRLDRGDPGPPPVTTRTSSRRTTADPTTLFPAEQYSACPQAMMGLSYDWAAMTTLVNNMSPERQHQPADRPGLGWLSLVGGGPFTVPPMDSELQVQADHHPADRRLEHAGPLVWQRLQHQTSVDDRMVDAAATAPAPTSRRPASRIYTIQVNTGGDPTSTLLQNCASRFQTSSSC